MKNAAGQLMLGLPLYRETLFGASRLLSNGGRISHESLYSSFNYTVAE